MVGWTPINHLYFTVLALVTGDGTTVGYVVGFLANDTSVLEAAPIVSSIFIGVAGVVLAWMSRADNKAKQRAADQAAEAATKLSALSIGQEWVVQALELAKADNAELRKTLIEQQMEHETAIRGWQAKVEKQEDEIIALHIEVRALKRRLGLE